MKAVVFDTFGGPEVLRVTQIEEPHAASGQVRVVVKAIGVNALDWKIRSGNSPFPVQFPHVGGLEVAGIVDEVGADTEGVSIGDEVLGWTRRGMAERAVLAKFAHKPPTMPWRVAAALPTAIETATRTLRQLGLTAGHTLLINGASGSVGSAAAQLAIAAGARVIGSASDRNHAFLTSIGCTPIAYGTNMINDVHAAAPDGVHLALDCAGHGALADLVRLVGNPDRVITIADGTAAEHQVRFSATPTPDPTDLATAANAVADGRFTVRIGPVFTLDQAAEAHHVGQTGRTDGKIILLVND